MNRVRFFLSVVALALLASCARRPDPSDWLARAEEANTEADRLVPRGDVQGAKELLRAAAESTPPVTTSPGDARAVRQDLFYRLATLETEHGDPREAVRYATRGLALGRGEDAFTTNLVIARGKALERLGDPDAASADYHDALVLTEKLLDRSLGGRPSTP